MVTYKYILSESIDPLKFCFKDLLTIGTIYSINSQLDGESCFDIRINQYTPSDGVYCFDIRINQYTPSEGVGSPSLVTVYFYAII